MTGSAVPLPLAGRDRRRSNRVRGLRYGISKLGVTLFTASWQ